MTDALLAVGTRKGLFLARRPVDRRGPRWRFPRAPGHRWSGSGSAAGDGWRQRARRLPDVAARRGS
jgi:hypothetical protein